MQWEAWGKPVDDAPGRGSSWYLSAMAVIQNEALHLDEWLAFCVLQGVERILLYDNSSTDNSAEVVQPWIDAGIVELIDWPIHWKSGAQAKAYEDALRRLRGRSRWVAFIDPDEFLFSPTGETVAEVLSAYEAHAGVIVNWQCYGTSGHGTRPAGLTIENYTRRARTNWTRNRRVKSIVDPMLVAEPFGPHLFKVAGGCSLVTEDYKPVRLVRSVRWRRLFRHIASRLPYLFFDPYAAKKGSPQQVSVSRLRINHYVTRSHEDLLGKYKDRNGMQDRDRRSHARYHDRNEVEDPILAGKAADVEAVIARMRAVPAVLTIAAE